MPVNTSLADEVWWRYEYMRDNGHLDYVKKVRICEDFFTGQQWDAADLAILRAQRRPAITINKIISTVSNVMGEQIFNRAEINFRPARGFATAQLADIITKVFRQIADNNMLDWLRSDVFADGTIGSRGFYDVRLGFDDNVAGEVRVSQLNPKNVLIDPDADEYDPDKWSDVINTKWMSPDMIALLYNEDDAKALEATPDYSPYGYDSIDWDRDRFGNVHPGQYWSPDHSEHLVRNVRVLDRQYIRLDRREFFVDTTNGDMRPVPKEWDRNRIAFELQQGGYAIMKKLAPRVRWTVVADKYVLHDDWSPYKHFTTVPYFPHFRRGKTCGLVENLVGPQELLNKVSSQELHVVNTTANSGWKIKKNALTNMSIGELENRGATTGLVLELDDVSSAEKIEPNQTPTGLDRISFKAEQHIDAISGVSKYDKGFAREDVAAKAVRANQAASSANTAKITDNLRRSDWMLARNILDIVQEYYTEERVMFIVSDRLTNETQQLIINQTSDVGRIVNDLTIGEYAVVVTSEPERDTFEDTQFDQAVMLKTEAGVQIPDSVLIKASKLRDKAEIVKGMEAQQNSPEAQEQKELAKRGQVAEVQTKEAEALQKQSDAKLKSAKSIKELQEAGQTGQFNAELQAEMQKAQAEHDLKVQEADRQYQLDVQKMEREFALKQRMQEQEMALKRKSAADDALLKRAQAAAQIRATEQAAPAETAAAPAMMASGGQARKVRKPRAFKVKKTVDGGIEITEG